jgi:Xaa-Pro dipeptidase
MEPVYAAFPTDVHRQRIAAARELLKREGLSGCISFAPEHLYYFGGYDSWVSVNSPQALIFTAASDEPTIILRDTDISLARESSWIADVRSYRLMQDDVPALIAAVAREKGMSGRIGIELQSYALPYALGAAIAKNLAKAELVDATSLLGSPRLFKSAAEIGYLRTAARYANIGLDAARRTLKPGITEIALAAAIEGAIRSVGSDYWSIPTELTSGFRSAGGHGTPRAKVIEPGDLVHVEFAGVERRYHATALQTLAAGEPSARARDIYDVARASLQAGIDATRPGMPVAAIEEASLVPVRRAGLEHAALMRFGYGIGIAYPPIWLEPLQISRGVDDTMRAGMVFVLHSYLQLPDEGIGVIQGGTYLLGDDGLEMLVGAGAVPLEVV